MEDLKPYQRQFPAGDTSGICWDFTCPCGFNSAGWPTEALAQARLDQHLEEHKTGVPAPDKDELLVDPEHKSAAALIADALGSVETSAKSNGKKG